MKAFRHRCYIVMIFRFSRNLKTLCPDNKSFSLIVVLFNSNEYNEDVANNETIHDMSSKVNVQVRLVSLNYAFLPNFIYV